MTPQQLQYAQWQMNRRRAVLNAYAQQMRIAAGYAAQQAEPNVGLKFAALEDGSTLKFAKYRSDDGLATKVEIPFDAHIEHSVDGGPWTAYSGQTLSIPKGSYVSMRASAPNESGFYKEIATSIVESFKFSMAGKISADGSIQHLLVKDGTRTDVPDSCFSELFGGCKALVHAPDLCATQLSSACYYGMFQDCTSLSAAPALPAEEMKPWCYAHMFNGCSALASMPELPSKALADNCYSSMFYGCTALSSISPLATSEDATLAAGCYQNMFRNCTSLSVYARMEEGTQLVLSVSDAQASGLEKWSKNMLYNTSSFGVPTSPVAGEQYYS